MATFEDKNLARPMAKGEKALVGEEDALLS